MKKNNSNKQGGNYDWFKNGSAGIKKNKTPKERAKSIWKIVKILIYISLAALSLTGCVQSFVIGSSTYTGQGMELYTNKEDIAPHVVTYNMDTKEGILTLNTKANYWLSDKKELKSVHDKIKADGGDISTWKTENNAVQIIVDGKVLANGKADDSHPITYVDNKPLVYSQSSGIDAKASGFSGYTFKTKGVKMFKPSSDHKSYTLVSKNGYDLGKAPKPTGKEIDKWAKDYYTISESIFTFQNTTFDALYQAFAKTQLFKDVAGYTGTIKDSKKVAKIDKYNQILSSLFQKTGVGPVDSKGNLAKDDFSNIAELNSYKTNSSKGASPLGFNLSTKTKLRAIYDWNTSWSLGPFYGLFIYPLSRLTLAIMESLPMMSGWETLITIAIVTILIRTFAYLLNFKSTLQQVKQQELNAKKATIEAKYEQYKGNKQMEQRKRQELSEMFKKEGVSPLGSIGSIFLTMPLFLAMWKIIGGIAHVKSTSWLSINFGQTSYKELFQGEWQYLPLMLTAAIVQGISLFIPRLLTKRRDKNRINAHQKAAMKKANKTQNIMMAVFVFMALIFSAGLQIYWIFGGLFTILQNILNHHIIKRQSRRRKMKRVKINK